jgi:hypothetical protein
MWEVDAEVRDRLRAADVEVQGRLREAQAMAEEHVRLAQLQAADQLDEAQRLADERVAQAEAFAAQRFEPYMPMNPYGGPEPDDEEEAQPVEDDQTWDDGEGVADEDDYWESEAEEYARPGQEQWRVPVEEPDASSRRPW